MKTITEQMTVGDIVTEVPKSGDVLWAAGIDFVNDGSVKLGDAAFEQGAPVENLLYEINSLGTENQDGIDIKYLDEHSIIKYIQRRYHEDLRDELPVLESYIDKVEKENPELKDIYLNLKNTLLKHIEEEDSNVFPLLESFIDISSDGQREALKPRVHALKNEHKEITDIFETIHELTNDFTPSQGDSGELRFVYGRLEKLEKDTMAHLHLENNILFERLKTAHV